MPLAATTTKVHITSNSKSPMNGVVENETIPKSERASSQEQRTETKPSPVPQAAKSEDSAPRKTPKNRDARPDIRSQASDIAKAANEPASWLNWFSKAQIATDGQTSNANGDAVSVGKSDLQSTLSQAHQDASTPSERRRNSEPSPMIPSVQQEEAPRSWLKLWGNASTQPKSSSSASTIGLASSPRIGSNEAEPQPSKLLDPGPGSVSNPEFSRQPVVSTNSSYGWAFWSRDQRKSDNDKTHLGRGTGELALVGSSSQPKLESAVLEARDLSSKVGKRQRPQSLETTDGPKKPQDLRDNAQEGQIPESISLAQKTTPKVTAESKNKRKPENLLLPSFRSTYSTVERPSLMQHLSRLLQMRSSSEPRHVNIVQNPPRVKRALAIVSLVNLFCVVRFPKWLT